LLIETTWYTASAGSSVCSHCTKWTPENLPQRRISDSEPKRLRWRHQ